MSEGTRIPLAEARAIAGELLALLNPYCERLEVVGSIRRERPTIGDIELLAVPRLVDRFDMFGLPTGQDFDVLADYCTQMVRHGLLTHRPDKNGRSAFGSRYKRLSYQGIGLDLFSVLQPAQWGVLSVIRTGSADFSHRLVTPVEQGGWMPQGMYCRDGALWCATQDTAFETPEEADVFAAIGRSYVPPEQREVPR